jgi:hypothetical protein
MEERDINTLMQSDGNVGRNVRVDILHLISGRCYKKSNDVAKR